MDQQTNVAPIEAGSKPAKKLMPVFQMLAESIEYYKANFRIFFKLIVASFVVSLPVYIVGALFGIAFISFPGNWLVLIIGAIIFLAALCVTIYFALRVQVGILLVFNDPKKTFKEIFKASKEYVSRYFITSLLVGILVFLWTLLLIVPGVIFGVFYAFALYVVIFENYKGMNSLKRSKELVSGYWWSVLGRFIFIGIMAMLVSIVISIPFVLFQEGSAGYNVYNLISSVIMAIITPIYVIYTYWMYKDLKTVKGPSQIIK